MRSTSRPERAALALGALALGLLLAYPLRNAHAILDDFLYLALARHVDNPWVLFAQDPIGSYFFRPVVMLAWWLTVAAFGDLAPLHYAFSIAVHVGNGVLLHLLLRRYGVAFPAAACAALVFVVHPSAFSASAWLSDRFDLFALAFGLGLLIALEAHLSAPRMRTWALLAALALATALSKEIGFALLAAAGLAALWPANARPAARALRWKTAGAIAACGLVALAARELALRASPEGMFLARGIAATVGEGLANWTAQLPGFLVVRRGNPVGVAAWAIALAAIAALAFVPAVARRIFRGELARPAALGLALMVLAAAVQSPVVGALPLAPQSPERFEFAALAGSRFYYVAFAGLAVLMGALLESAARAPLGRWFPRAAVAVIGIALVGLMASSRSIGREWATYTRERSGVFVLAAVEAVASRPAAPGCLVFLIDLPPEAKHFRDVADTAVKHALPRGHRALACFIQTEHAPWNHLVASGLPEHGERPLQVIRIAGAPFAPLRVGNLTQYYLANPGAEAVVDEARAGFLAWTGGRFVDVTEDVRSRKRLLRLYDDRPSH